MTNSDKTKITENTKNRELIIERMFNAPREQTWQAWTDPEQLAEWWGPEGWRTTIPTFEFKPGGIWHYSMTCEDKNQREYYGTQVWNKVIFHDISEPERIAYEDHFSDAEGNTDESMPGMHITISFIPQGNATKLVIRCKFESEEDLQKVLDMGIREGMISSFERLERLLQQSKSN